jgi:hypothetical protein
VSGFAGGVRAELVLAEPLRQLGEMSWRERADRSSVVGQHHHDAGAGAREFVRDAR